MALQFDFDKMGRLLENFYAVSGVRYSLADVDGNLLCASHRFTDFCSHINASPEGHARCRQCDREAFARVREVDAEFLTYRCHAGVLETVIPIRGRGGIIAFIMFGQMIGMQDAEAQWQAARRLLSWHPTADALYGDFLRLKPAGEGTIRSCAELLLACSSYLWLEGVIKAPPKSDWHRLEDYIDAHYAENPSLGTIAHDLSMSKTKLCGLASAKGITVKNMLTARQMEEAKQLLANTDSPVSDVAAFVGIRDYNYFTKLFKAKCGQTPSAYRRGHHN